MSFTVGRFIGGWLVGIKMFAYFRVLEAAEVGVVVFLLHCNVNFRIYNKNEQIK